MPENFRGQPKKCERRIRQYQTTKTDIGNVTIADMSSSSSAPQPLFVACLCAAWCRTCGDYQATFDALKTKFTAPIQWAWVDIEDHAELLDEVDIETFPTLLVIREQDVLFLGPVLPQAMSAIQVVQRALDGRFSAIPQSILSGLPAQIKLGSKP